MKASPLNAELFGFEVEFQISLNCYICFKTIVVFVFFWVCDISNVVVNTLQQRL